MELERLSDRHLAQFVDYCKRHRSSVDDSFLYDEDLKTFNNNEENPTYVLKRDGAIIGVVSLMINDYFLRGKRGRFRIFHSEIETVDAYRTLLQSILPHTAMIDHFFLFLHDENEAMRTIFEQLGFEIERYSFVLDRPEEPVNEVSIPEGYTLETFQFDRDEALWCEVRNDAFASLAGAQTPVTPDEVKKMQAEEGYIEGGIKLLFHHQKPVGLVRTAKEMHEGEEHIFIHILAVKTAYHKKGLGRNLLREGLRIGNSIGLPKALITVNAENEKAVNLYLSEGFRQYETMVCYKYELK